MEIALHRKVIHRQLTSRIREQNEANIKFKQGVS
jgi:hypothetical protein